MTNPVPWRTKEGMGQNRKTWRWFE